MFVVHIEKKVDNGYEKVLNGKMKTFLNGKRV
jgi:hypothetical protein